MKKMARNVSSSFEEIRRLRTFPSKNWILSPILDSEKLFI